jgi:hypothetical protein
MLNSKSTPKKNPDLGARQNVKYTKGMLKGKGLKNNTYIRPQSK